MMMFRSDPDRKLWWHTWRPTFFTWSSATKSNSWRFDSGMKMSENVVCGEILWYLKIKEKNSWLDWTVQKIKFKNLTKTLDSYSSENEFINTKNYLQITQKTKIVMRSQPVSIKSYKSCLIFVVVSILFYFYYSDLTLWAGLRIRSNFNQIRIQIFRKTEIQIQSSYIRKENDHYLFSFLGN